MTLYFQDSLWNVKHPMPVDPGMNGFVTASGYYPDTQPGYPGGQYGYQQQQQQQQYQQQPQQYNYEEYTHYPHPEVIYV